MEWKKRGIQLKSLRPDDPGHLTLCEEVIRLSSLTEEMPFLESMDDEPLDMSDEPSEETEPLDLPRVIRRELEETLDLLDEAIAAANHTPGKETG